MRKLTWNGKVVLEGTDNTVAADRTTALEQKCHLGSLKAFVARYHPKADVVVYNGFATEEDFSLIDGDEIVTLERGVMPEREALGALMTSRHTPGVHGAMVGATVGVAGLGGLGSHIAMALARMGIGRLVLVDFDVVEPTNLNRQAYAIHHLGMTKALALKEQLAAIHPYTEVVVHALRVNPENAMDLFGGCDVVVEAFDRPDQKAMLVETLLTKGQMPVVAASGVAGLYSGNTVRAQRFSERLYLVGDQVHGARPGEGLMAPRVMIAAGHQALLVVQLLTGQVDL